MLENWYFTFGCGHYHNDVLMADKYVKIEGSYGDARNIMVSLYGLKWAFQYSEEVFMPQIQKYGLHCHKVIFGDISNLTIDEECNE